MSSSLAWVEAEGLRFSFARDAKSAALLRQLSEKPKLAGMTSASSLQLRPAPDRAASGISQIDGLTGGLPRGCLTEICGPESSGRTSLLLSALAAATGREEICTLIDASDAFDPNSAAAAGVDLERFLWTLPRPNHRSSGTPRKRRNAASPEEWERQRREDPVEQALRAADLLLQSSGFGVVAIDLAGVPLRTARRIPLTTWFRFRRAVENTSTVLLVIGTQACAQSCATLSLRLNSALGSQISVLSSQLSVLGERPSSNMEDDRPPSDGNSGMQPSHTELLTGIEIQAEILHSRSERKPAQSVSDFTSKAAWIA